MKIRNLLTVHVLESFKDKVTHVWNRHFKKIERFTVRYKIVASDSCIRNYEIIEITQHNFWAHFNNFRGRAILSYNIIYKRVKTQNKLFQNEEKISRHTINDSWKNHKNKRGGWLRAISGLLVNTHLQGLLQFCFFLIQL